MDSTGAEPTTVLHVVAMPFPCQGHINALMSLCKLLSSRKHDLLITFVVTEEWLRCIGSEPKPDNIRFASIPTVIERAKTVDFGGFNEVVKTKMEAPFEQLLDRLEPPVARIIADFELQWSFGVGIRRNIPLASLWTMSASFFSSLHHYHVFAQAQPQLLPLHLTGVEVKPGNPFKHEHDDTKGRLHLSMATLGLGTAEGRSILQCNIGNKSPVFLCTLYPVNSESLQVNLEFEEADDVVFSVLGPRSIFLSGYYVSTSQQEPCGEDIADTETDLSENSDEDEYEKSFIDDDEPEVYPPSPISNDEKEMLYNEKPKNGKGICRWLRKSICRWLRKSYQMSDSDDGGCSQPKNIVDGSGGEPVLQSEDKDSFPIVVLYKSKTTTKKTPEEVKSKADEGTGGTGDKKTEDDVNHAIEPKIKADNVIVDAQPKMQSDPPINSMPSASEVGPENGAKPKRKRKERLKEEKPLKADNANCSNILKEDKAPKDEARVDNMGQDMCMKNGQEWEAANDKGVELPDTVSLPSIEVSPEDVERPKKRKKGLTKEGKNYEAEHKHSTVVEDNNTQQNDKEAELPENLLLPSAEVGFEPGEKLKKKSKQRARDVKASKSDSNHENVVREDGAQQNRAKAEDIVLGLPVTFKQNPNPANYKSLDSNSHVFAAENHSSGKKIKKKKNKTQENGKDLNMNTSLLSVDKKADDKSSQVWTLSNVLILEVLEMGKPDSKVAASGKKISVNYNGKLKNNGESVDSNDGDAPFKFHLGVGKVMEGWDIGINGMRVGEKRRLIIPPSMGYGSKGHGENVPPDSWLVYDVELVKVH